MFAGKPIIGLAGGIGAGKSHVAKLFEAAGCCRVASDEMVRAAYTHPAVRRAVVDRFGDRVLDPAGRVDRKAIADIVFRNADERVWLEKLLHPVANQARLTVMGESADDAAVVAYVWDSPLLFETKLNKLCDVTLFVDAPRADRLNRVASRGWGENEFERREMVQMPLDKKRESADYRVCNAESDPVTAARVGELLADVLRRVSPESCDGCEPQAEAATPPCACRAR